MAKFAALHGRQSLHILSLFFPIFIQTGFSVSNHRRLDTDRLRTDDKMLAELAESGSAERIHLDSWLNPSTSNTKSCCDRVPKKYFVGKGMITYRLKLPANSSAVYDLLN